MDDEGNTRVQVVLCKVNERVSVQLVTSEFYIIDRSTQPHFRAFLDLTNSAYGGVARARDPYRLCSDIVDDLHDCEWTLIAIWYLFAVPAVCRLIAIPFVAIRSLPNLHHDRVAVGIW